MRKAISCETPVFLSAMYCELSTAAGVGDIAESCENIPLRADTPVVNLCFCGERGSPPPATTSLNVGSLNIFLKGEAGNS